MSSITFKKYNGEKNSVSSSFATFGNIIEACIHASIILWRSCKIGTFQRNISTIFQKFEIII